MFRTPLTRFMGPTILGALLLVVVQSADAQVSRKETLRAPDGFPINITYYPFTETKENSGSVAMNAPVVVMIPGDNETRLMWDKGSSPRDLDPLPVQLQKRGYAVITVDPRKHGESIVNADDRIQANDYAAIALGDMGAVKDFLYAEHQAQRLNMQKLAVIGSGTGAAIAASFADLDWKRAPYDDAPLPAERTPRGQDVKALVLISPETSAGRIKTTTALRPLRGPAINMGLLVVVGKDDSADKRQAKTVYDAFAGGSKGASDNPRVALSTVELKDRGISLLRQRQPYTTVLKYLEDHVKTMNIPWQDRRSRLER